MATKIEWTDETWNPVVGCTKVSQGCKHCYAKILHDKRHKAYLAGKAMPEQYAKPFETVQLRPDRLEKPLHWREPRRVFVNSVSDLFHESLPDRAEWSDFITRLWLTMLNSPQHTFQILTKRPHIMKREVKALIGAGFPVLPNVQLGTSVEDQKAADERLPHLLQTPAAVRFVSCEPMLGSVDLWPWLSNPSLAAVHGRIPPMLDWVIVGGESGPGARPMHPDWARSIRNQCCQAAGVKYFFKQWGEYGPLDSVRGFDAALAATGNRYVFPNGQQMFRVGKKAAGRLLDGREWNEYPEYKEKGG